MNELPIVRALKDSLPVVRRRTLERFVQELRRSEADRSKLDADIRNLEAACETLRLEAEALRPLVSELENLRPLLDEVDELRRVAAKVHELTPLADEVEMLRPLVAEVQELRTIKEEVDGLRALKVEVEELRPLTAEVETLRPLRAEVGSLRKKIDCLEPLVPQVETLRQEIAARNARCGTQIESPETNTNKRNYFLIVSPGRSATQWLTRGLNRHEKVLAIHATEFCRDKALLEGSQEERDSIQRRVAERAGAHAFTLDDYFDIIDDPMSDFAAIGNVHGRGDTEVLTDPSRFRRKYLMSYIVRHPVIRLRSIFSRWQFGNRQSDQTRAHMRKNFERVRGMLKSAESTYDLDFRKEDDWLFAYAVVYLLTEEAKYLRSTPFVMNYERLVTDHNYLKRGLEKATGGTVEFSPDYVSRLIRTGAVDQHNHDLEYSESLLASWIGWRRDLFESMIDQFSLRPSYSEFGYSV